TRRDGIIGNIDISADILSKYNLANEYIVGKPFENIDKENNIDYLQHEYEKMVSIANIRPAVVNTFVGIVAVAWVISIVLLILRNKIPINKKVFSILKEFIKLGLIIPLAFLISPIFNFATMQGIVLSLIITTLVLYILGKILFKNDIANMGFVACITIIVIVLDSIFGTRLMQNNIMSYDTMIGARYYGIGNEYEGVVIGCSILALATLVNYKKIPNYLVGVLSLIILITTAYPKMGANVGGAISESIAFVLLVLLVFDIKMDFKKSILVGLSAVVIVLIFAFLDITLGSESHLGAFLEQIYINGPSAVIQTFARKIQMNIDIANGPIMATLYVILISTVAYFIFKPRKLLKVIEEKHRYIYKGFIAMMVGCIVTLLVNDSGVVAASTAAIYMFIPLSIISINMLIFKDEI
ncbi:MAG: hypothetical protein ACRCXT_15325, partial [Paraclostridium sp.]